MFHTLIRHGSFLSWCYFCLQDLGNVNVSFFTPRELYNREENLALIVKVLRERWKLDVEASPRDDILVDRKFKISFFNSLGDMLRYISNNVTFREKP